MTLQVNLFFCDNRIHCNASSEIANRVDAALMKQEIDLID